MVVLPVLVKRKMSLTIYQINGLRSTEFIFFANLLFIVTLVTGTNFRCANETILWGINRTPIVWPETIASDKKIASDCIDSTKKLLTRKCDGEEEDWIPNIVDTNDQCLHYRESYVAYGRCPPGYRESTTGDVCYQFIYEYSYLQSWKHQCLLTGASSLSFLDLNTDEQFSILQELLVDSTYTFPRLTMGLPAQNTIGSGQIDSTTVDVELQWLLPARYGSILKLSNNSFEVICRGYKNLCVETCLSMNISAGTADKPFQLTLDDCDNIESVLCVSRKNDFVRDVGCSTKGYYRVAYFKGGDECYSITKFNDPVTIDSATSPEEILKSHCAGNKMFRMDNLESLLIYRQLISKVELREQERCLFGMASFTSIITYSAWNHLDHSAIEFTNWDKSVDFSTVESRPDSYLTVNSVGEWRWESSATCIVCAMHDSPRMSKLTLQFDSVNSELYLTVTYRENLWRENDTQLGFLCFALIANRYVEVPVNETFQSYAFLLENVGIGSYWCSGQFILIHYVESNRVTAFGMVFAFHVYYYCEGAGGCDSLDYGGMFERFLNLLIGTDPIKIDGVWYIEYDTDAVPLRLTLKLHVMISVEDEIVHSRERNDIGLSEYELRTQRVLKILQGLPSKRDDFRFDTLSVTSREFCWPEAMTNPNLYWNVTKAGVTTELSNGYFLFTRTCSRARDDGAVWNDHEIHVKTHVQSFVSRNLTDIYNNFQSTQQISEVLFNVSTIIQNASLNEADVFVISEIFEKVTDFLTSDQIGLTFCDLKIVFEIFNDLMLITKDVAATTSSQMNSTNSLLTSLDKILLNQAYNMTVLHDRSYEVVYSIKTPFIANYIIDPEVNGLSGIALVNKDPAVDNEDFRSYAVRFLPSDQSIERLLNESVVLASFVPQKLIETWKSPKIIFTLFFNDILFQSHQKQPNTDGRIISLTILHSTAKLSSSIPFFFKANTSLYPRSSYASAQSCGYWSLSGSEWSGSGCSLNELSLQDTDTILCECSHLTHFGNLINTKIKYSDNDEQVLNVITLTGCSLSLAGTIGIFLTAIIFRTWRSKSSSKFLLQLSAAIALQMILLIFINSNDNVLIAISNNVYGCIAIGALIHYSVLVVFFWMLIVAYLQFIRYVVVFKQITTANFLLKSSIFGWGVPMLPVFAVLTVHPKSYVPSPHTQFCYPSGNGLWFGLFMPVILIVVANMIVFIAVIVSLVRASSKSAACKANNKNVAIWSQLRLSVFLFFLLGFSWIFAFLSSHSVAFSYLFCLTATLQGFVLFFYFVVLDPVARNLWKRFLTKICCY